MFSLQNTKLPECQPARIDIKVATEIEGEGEGDEGRGSGADESDAGRGNTVGVLHLRGGRRRGPRVAWTEDVVDNEGMGKKKSKSA